MQKETLEKIFKQGGTDLQLLDFDCDKSDEELLIYNSIFSHTFAKQFFGEEEIDVTNTNPVGAVFLPAWQYHLRYMVLLDVDEQLKYVEEYLN